jgi:Domain of unknown function (DUF4365)
MKALSPPNIESELSYAYLHAVASHAGMACSVANRHADNNGVDASLTAWGPFASGGYLTEISINVQLKATITDPADDGTHLSYFLKGTDRYDDLRSVTVSIPRILIVLFLPPNPVDWMKQSDEQLALCRCAYWQSLRGAPATSNASGTTVKLPKNQMFNAQALHQLAAQLSKLEFPSYPVL